MASTPGLTPRILGRAEAAHRALLESILAATGTTFPEWVALGLVAASDQDVERGQLLRRLRDSLKVDEVTAASALDALAAAGLVEAVPGSTTRVRLTSTGRERYGPIRAAVDETVSRLYDGLPPDELAAAGRVLAALTARADAALTRRAPRVA